MATEKYLGETKCHARKLDKFLALVSDVLFGVPSVIVARRHRGKCWGLERRGTVTLLTSVSVFSNLKYRHLLSGLKARPYD